MGVNEQESVGKSGACGIELAIECLLAEFSWNPWFTNTFWPENEKRVRLLLADLQSNVPRGQTLLDVGCYNGFMAFLGSQLGYRVTAIDAISLAERDQMFSNSGIEFLFANLNESGALASFPGDHFAAVIMGEVIEHILNHPLGLMKEVARVMQPGGLLLLTTPNPATLANAYRTVRGTHTLWGTPNFMNLPKIENARVTDIGDVHYREYRTSELARLLGESGFEIETTRYFGHGASHQQSTLKKLLKGNPLGQLVMSHRVFGANQYILARRGR
jgi:2-polyprenyl-3-methyl-5-hydroxy-6-metoxy-1,4-benzoquinol methylase